MYTFRDVRDCRENTANLLLLLQKAIEEDEGKKWNVLCYSERERAEKRSGCMDRSKVTDRTGVSWHKQSKAQVGWRSLMTKKKKITYNSFSSTFCQSPCLLVHLESVLGQPAARYHYLLDSGQSNQAACSCFIELDIYNMWLMANISYRTAVFTQQSDALVNLERLLSL